MKYSTEMHEHIDKGECGAKKYKRLMTVSWGYTKDLSAGLEERREVDKMIDGGN